MATQVFSTSPYGKALFNTYGGRRPTVGILGDSYGAYLGAAIQYACAKHFAADIAFDNRTNADGGRLFSVGGTTTAQMLSTQVPQFQANPADIAFIWTGYNSSPSSLATAQSEAANLTDTADACLAAGAKMVVIFGHGPKAVSTPWAIASMNTILEAYARVTSGVWFIDIIPLLGDPASVSTTGIPFLGTAAAYQAASFDGVHPSGHACREHIAPAVANILSRVARKRISRAGVFSDTFDPVNRPDTDLLGGAGLMGGTSGLLNSVANSGVAGISSTRRWNMVTSGTGLTGTPSLVTGSDGFIRQRMTMSGTLSTVGYIIYEIQPTITNVNNSDTTREYDFECTVELTGVTGLQDIYLTCEGGGAAINITMPNASGGGSNDAHRFDDTVTDGPLFFYTLRSAGHTGNNPRFRVVCYFTSGTTLAGTIDLSRASVRRVAP